MKRGADDRGEGAMGTRGSVVRDSLVHESLVGGSVFFLGFHNRRLLSNFKMCGGAKWAW